MLKIQISVDINSNISISFLKDLINVSNLPNAFSGECEIATSVKKLENYDSLSFGYQLKSNGIVVNEITKPDPNVTYISSDNGFIDIQLLELDPETDHELTFWCEESGIRSEETFTFTTPSLYPTI